MDKKLLNIGLLICAFAIAYYSFDFKSQNKSADVKKEGNIYSFDYSQAKIFKHAAKPVESDIKKTFKTYFFPEAKFVITTPLDWRCFRETVQFKEEDYRKDHSDGYSCSGEDEKSMFVIKTMLKRESRIDAVNNAIQEMRRERQKGEYKSKLINAPLKKNDREGNEWIFSAQYQSEKKDHYTGYAFTSKEVSENVNYSILATVTFKKGTLNSKEIIKHFKNIFYYGD